MADLIGRLAARSRDTAVAVRRRPDAAFRSFEQPDAGLIVSDLQAPSPLDAAAAHGARGRDGTPATRPTADCAAQPSDNESSTSVAATTHDVQPLLEQPDNPTPLEPARQRLPLTLVEAIKLLAPDSAPDRTGSPAGDPSGAATERRDERTRGATGPPAVDTPITVSIGQLIVRAAPATQPAPPAPKPPSPADARPSLQDYLRGKRGS